MLEVRLLRQFEIRLAGAPVEVPLRSAQSLLAYLLLTAGTPHRREKLAGLFWPEATEAGARQSLRQALWHLRRAFAGDADVFLLADAHTIAFNAQAQYWLDAAVLQQVPGPQAPIDELVRVVSAYGGELLPGFYDDWVSLERERLAAVFERQMQRLLDRLADAQAWPRLLEWTEKWLAFGQVPEPAYRALMLARAGLGDLAGVAAAYQRCRDDLARELGVEPSEQTRRLFEELRQGQPPGLAARPVPGQSDRYTLQDVIGRGGMGVVYRAHDRLLDRPLAVKLLSSTALGTSGQARLLREAQAAARLQHPNIVSVFDAGDLDGTPAIFMELVDGPTLERQPPGDLAATLRMGRDVAAALEHAHAHGVLHRDVKPGNIVLGADGTAKLMDFGLAFLPAAARLTQEAQPAGTALYMAPELLRGEASSAQSDLYALGATLYELLTGCPPFEGEDVTAVISQHLHTPVTPPSLLRAGLPTALDDLIVRLLSKAPADRPASAGEVRAVLERLARGEAFVPDAPAPGQPPYRGLQHFDEADAEWFFGREQVVARLVGRLRQQRLLVVVVGASGSGKSSVVRAGILPALRRGEPLADGSLPPGGSAEWEMHVITPTTHPLEALAASLTAGSESVKATLTLMDDLASDPRGLHVYAGRHLGDRSGLARRLLLVVDQFEELFTCCRDEDDRRAYIDNLLYAAAPETGGPTVVVLTLRADFYAHCAAYPNLREALARYQEFIGPMSQDELRRAIEAPAERGGWTLEGGLVELLLKDVGDELGALPLLSHALLETWKRRRGRTLTLRGYAESGGVRGAIAQTAETVYVRLAPEAQAIARNIFLRLTELGEGTQDTRRRAAPAELIPRPEDATAVEAVLQTLSEARLITAGLETVEVAHEALIREWPTLQRWLAEDRESLRLHRHLTDSALEWGRRERDSGELYRGARLAQAVEWAQFSDRAGDLNMLERDFLAASRSAAEQEAAEREAQRQRELEAARQVAESAQRAGEAARQAAETEQRRAREQARANRRLRGLAVGLALLLLVAAGAGGFAWQQRQQAQRDTHLTRAHELAAESVNQLTIDPERSVWLALYALEESQAAGAGPLPEAEEALHRAVQATRIQLTLPHENIVACVGFSADGTHLITVDAQAVVRVWDLTVEAPTLQKVREFTLQDPIAGLRENFRLALSPDGRHVAIGAERAVTVWDVATGQPERQLEGYEWEDVGRMAFNPDSTQLGVASNTGSIVVWELASGERLRTLPAPPIDGIAFNSDSTFLALASRTRPVPMILDIVNGKVLQTNAVDFFDAGLGGVGYSPNGEYLAAGGTEGTLRFWDASSGASIGIVHASASDIGHLTFSPDGRQIATAHADGQVQVWEPLTGRKLFELVGHTNAVIHLAYNPESRRIASASLDRTVKVWDATPTHEWRTLSVADRPVRPGETRPSQVYDLAFSPINTPGELRLAAATSSYRVTVDYLVYVWEAHGAQILQRWDADSAWRVVFNSDGVMLATLGNEQAVRVWNTETLRPAASLPTTGTWPSHIAVRPGGAQIVVGDCRGRVHLWTPVEQASSTIFEIPATTDGCSLTSLAISPDGGLIAAGGQDYRVRLVDTSSGGLLHLLGAHEDLVNSLAFSPDRRLLASGSEDATIVVWDLDRGEPQFTLRGHGQGILSLEFSPDSRSLVSGSRDGQVKLWDIATGQEKLTLMEQDAPVVAVAHSPDGNYLAVAGTAGQIRIFLTRLEDLITLAHTRVTRSLTTEECQKYLRLPQCPAALASSETGQSAGVQ